MLTQPVSFYQIPMPLGLGLTSSSQETARAETRDLTTWSRTRAARPRYLYRCFRPAFVSAAGAVRGWIPARTVSILPKIRTGADYRDRDDVHAV
jgi:hypothetical protein